MKTSGTSAGAISIAWGLVVAVGAYAVVRAVEFFVDPPLDTTVLIASVHAGFFWRALTVSYAGGIAAFVAFVITRKHAGAAARALVPAIGAAALLAGLQSAFLP